VTVTRLLWVASVVASVLAVALGIRVLVRPLVAVALPPLLARPMQAAPSPALSRQQVDSLAAIAVARDPFRLARAPAAAVYDPQRGAEPVPAPSPKPTLTLDGIVWDPGSAPAAVLEGFPGVEGSRVVRVGETVGGLKISTIGRDRVVVVGMDTTWNLRVKTW